MADTDSGYELVASFFTLSGAGFGEAPRHSFIERCEAAGAAGFTGIGLHVDDLPRTLASGLDIAGMQAVLVDNGLRVVEIEFLGAWAIDADPAELDRTLDRIEAVADAFGGRHVSAGEFRGDTVVDLDAAATRLDALARRDSPGEACRSPSRASPGQHSPGRPPSRSCCGGSRRRTSGS